MESNIILTCNVSEELVWHSFGVVYSFLRFFNQRNIEPGWQLTRPGAKMWLRNSFRCSQLGCGMQPTDTNNPFDPRRWLFFRLSTCYTCRDPWCSRRCRPHVLHQRLDAGGVSAASIQTKLWLPAWPHEPPIVQVTSPIVVGIGGSFYNHFCIFFCRSYWFASTTRWADYRLQSLTFWKNMSFSS